MFSFLFTFFIFACSVAQSQVYGPSILNLGSTIKDIEMSSNGNKIFVALSTDMMIKVYENTGSGFALQQTISLPEEPQLLEVSKEIIVTCTNNSQAFVYELQDGIYENIQIISPCLSYRNIKITENGEFIFIQKNIYQVGIFQLINGNYEQIQEITSDTVLGELSLTKDFQTLVIIDYSQFFRVYKKDTNGFTLNESVSFSPYYGSIIRVVQDRIILAGISENVTFYLYNGTHYEFEKVFTTPEPSIMYLEVDENLQRILFGGTWKTTFIYNLQNNTYQQSYSEVNPPLTYDGAIDEEGLYYCIYMFGGIIKYYYECPFECGNCSFPTNCSSCIEGYTLEGTTCVQIQENQDAIYSSCVMDKYRAENVCEEYCHKKCKTCMQTKYDCFECAEFYIKNEKGQCVMNDAISLVTMSRPYLNVIRRKGLKFFFMALDDLWLYNYHKKQYSGILKEVFQTISFIEQKQWEISQLQSIKYKVEDAIQIIPEYNPFSNPTYLQRERKVDVFIDSTYSFYIFFIPLSLILIFVFNRVFYLLFNFEISKYLRPYSFWWIIFDVLIISNIEYFTFIGFRSLFVSFSFDFTTKLLNTLSILMLFLTLLASFSSYFIFYCTYKKLARYFLVNMFRFPSSYGLMIICFGARPFLKGAIHALLYQNWVLQIYLLMGVQILVIMCMFLFQMRMENYKSTISFMMESTYIFSTIILHVLILFRYEYLVNYSEFDGLLENGIQIVIYVMFSMLLMKLVWQLIPWDTICCRTKKDQDLDQKQQNEQKSSIQQIRPENQTSQAVLKKQIQKLEKQNKSYVVFPLVTHRTTVNVIMIMDQENKQQTQDTKASKSKKEKQTTKFLHIHENKKEEDDDVSVVNIDNAK